MKYLCDYENNEIKLKHICHPKSLINIIESGVFCPTFTGDYGADAGLNCFSEETGMLMGNAFHGEGAVLYLAWHGDSKKVGDRFPLPYPKGKSSEVKDRS